MKYLKLPILMAVLAAAFAAFGAATASATTLTSPEGTTLKAGTAITAQGEEGKTEAERLILHFSFGEVKCLESKISGTTSNTGGPTEAVKAPVETFTMSLCNVAVTVLKKGTLEFRGKPGSTDGDGTVTSSGTELTVELAGFHCILTTNETFIGTVTGSGTTGGNATLKLEGEIPRTAGRQGAFCGSKIPWTGSYKFTTPSTLNVDGEGPLLSGEVPTGTVGESVTVTWKNTGKTSATINDETNSNSEVAETTGTACTTIAAGGSCTSRKVKCLKSGEATLTVRDTTAAVEGKVTIKCDEQEGKLVGEVATGTIGETYTVTWKNTGTGSATVEDEIDSDSTVAETLGSGCGTISAGGSCTTRKVKCLKEGEATLTARDTPSVEGKVTIKCDKPIILKGKVSTGIVGETYTVTWENTGTGTATINDETNSNSEVAETTGTACTTIAGGGSCTTRKVKCLKAGESTLTIRDTTNSAEAQVTIKCDNILEGGPTTGKVGETVTVTWTNNSESAVTIEDESTSDGTVAETLGSSCGTISATSSCTNRKIKCLKAGESTITAVDTPSIEGKFIIKCS